MQELGNAITEFTHGTCSGAFLDDAAQAWASHALVTYQGRLLKRALDVSRAISNFVAELDGRPERD